MANIKQIRIAGVQYDIFDATAIHEQYTHPSHTAYESGLYKVTVDSEGHVTAATAVTSSDLWGKIGLTAGENISVSEPDTNGKITITNTYSHPNASGNTAPGSAALMKFVPDGQGHVTNGVQATSADITPLVNITGTGDTTVSNTNGTITVSSPAYTASDGIKRVDNVFKHTNSIDAGNTSNAAQTPASGATFTIPVISYDGQGHITGTQTSNVTLPVDPNQTVKVGSVTFGADDAVTFQVAGNQTTITGNATNKTITIDTSVLEAQVAQNKADIAAINGDGLGGIQAAINEIKDELADPDNAGLTTILDTVQTVLVAQPVAALTDVTISNTAATYSTVPHLAVDGEILVFEPGGVQGGTTTIATKPAANVIASPNPAYVNPTNTTNG